MPGAVVARKLVKLYGHGDSAVLVLDDVDVEVFDGEFLAIMGPSGSGKSTLMHCLAGLDCVDSGTVLFDGIDLTALNDRALTVLRRDRIGFIFQSFNLVPTLTAKRNILLPLTLAKKKMDVDWFNYVVDRLNLAGRLTHKPHELSGGQQQRVAIARALMTRPQVIFADEPTGNLDSASGAEVLDILQCCSRELEQSVVMVTHDAQAAACADRVVFMRDGQLVDTLAQPTLESITASTALLGSV